jgi:hypothetical protein
MTSKKTLPKPQHSGTLANQLNVKSAAPEETSVHVDPVPTLRTGSKQAQVIGLPSRDEGASLADPVSATGWLTHSTRGGADWAAQAPLQYHQGKGRERDALPHRAGSLKWQISRLSSLRWRQCRRRSFGTNGNA